MPMQVTTLEEMFWQVRDGGVYTSARTCTRATGQTGVEATSRAIPWWSVPRRWWTLSTLGNPETAS